MKRKIFISILGIRNYSKTNYYFKNKDNVVKTNFVQEATMNFFSKDWTKKDKAFIFLTNQARETNWVSPAQKNDNKKREPYKGLKEILEDQNFNFEIVDVDIPDGKNEKEIWDIFEKVFSVIEEDDEVYFDITHAFRSLPMLVMVLINYAKFLKNITVRSITYGNWEDRDKDNFSPIIDLTAFSELQDWTSAANDFVNFGNTNKISELTMIEITPILKSTKGQDKSASDLRRLANYLKNFSLYISTNNGPDIIKGEIFNKIKESLKNLKNDIIQPLNPILKKVENKIDTFSISKDVMNGFKVVDFCIESGLIQQAYTMLQESIISYILDTEKLDINNVKYRNVVSGCFKICKENYPIENWNNLNLKYKDVTNSLLKNKALKDLASTFNALTDKRNIINHAGFNDKSSKDVFCKLENTIIELNRRVKEKLNIK